LHVLLKSGGAEFGSDAGFCFGIAIGVGTVHPFERFVVAPALGDREHSRHRVANIVVPIRRVIDGIPAAPRCPPFQGTQLRDGARLSSKPILPELIAGSSAEYKSDFGFADCSKLTPCLRNCSRGHSPPYLSPTTLLIRYDFRVTANSATTA